MTTQLDLRDRPAEDHRDRLFEALDDLDTGEDVRIQADDDVDPHLVRYQIERDRHLAWAYADPDAEPRELTVAVGDRLEEGALGTIDVRDLKPQRRHRALLSIFEELGADEGFVLVNDHDPKPLYHELGSMHGDVVAWTYETQNPDEWRVAVEKTAASEADTDDGVVTRYDVREIPKPERHPTIHHRYGMLPEGGTMELVAPHEPRPLQREFRQQYGDTFTWSVVESEPGRCRVHVTKESGAEDGEDASGAGCDGVESTSDGDLDAAPTAEESIEVVDELDVRELPPAQRHDLIFEAYDALDAGRGFVLVNDHDPKPLYHQFDAEAGPEFRWSYRQRDPGEFRVLIAKAAGELRQETESAESPF